MHDDSAEQFAKELAVGSVGGGGALVRVDDPLRYLRQAAREHRVRLHRLQRRQAQERAQLGPEQLGRGARAEGEEGGGLERALLLHQIPEREEER